MGRLPRAAGIGKNGMSVKIVLIDDNDTYRLELAKYITLNGLSTESFNNLERALVFVRASRGGVVVVSELAIGSDHFFHFIPTIRGRQDCAVLILSQQREETDKVVALELGADDFIMKTTSHREILARIRAAVRRLTAPTSGIHEETPSGTASGTWQFRREKRELLGPHGLPIHLTSAEFSLLDALVEHTGHPLSRDYLSMVALGRHHNNNDRSIDNLVAKLRRKLGDTAKSPQVIKTARPIGYLFTGFRNPDKYAADRHPTDPGKD
jgi:two-component system OmpR family response regulator